MVLNECEFEITLESLTGILKEARQAAINSVHGEDGGSCNFDMTYILKKYPFLEEAMNRAGLNYSIQEDGRGRFKMAIYAPIFAQGYHNTNQAEAMLRVLAFYHIPCTMVYCID